MSAPGARRDVGRAATFAVIALAAVIAVRNATVYPAIAGYDAAEAIEYAEGLVRDGRLPDGTGSYYTPPGFFAIGGVAIELGEALGLDHPERVGQVFNALVAVATLLLLLALVRLLWPGREVLHLAAIVFFVACPVVMKSAAMFHPEPLSMLLSTAALVLRHGSSSAPTTACRCVVGLGLALGLAQLVRAWTLWTLGVVVLVLLVAAVTRPRSADGWPARSRSSPRSRSSSRGSGTGTSSGSTTARSSGSRTPRSPSGRAGRSGSSSAPGSRTSSRRRIGRRTRIGSSPSRTPRRGATTSASGGGSRSAGRPRPAPAASSWPCRSSACRSRSWRWQAGSRFSASPSDIPAAPSSASSSRSFRSPPSRASCTSGRRTRRPTATR